MSVAGRSLSPWDLAIGTRRACLLALLVILVLFDPPVALEWLAWPVVAIAGCVTAGLSIARRTRPLWWGYAAYFVLLAIAAAASGASGTLGSILQPACFLLLVWSVADEAGRAGAAAWTLGLLVCLALILPQLAGPQSMVVAGRVFTYRAVQQWSGYPEIGLLCLLGLAGTWALSASASGRTLRAACLVLTGFFAVGLLAVQSRAASAVAMLIAAWVAVVAMARWRRWASAALLVFGLIGAVAVVVRQPTLATRLAGAASAERDRPVGQRLEYWQGTLGLIGSHPWTGVGPGQFQQAYARTGVIGAPPHAHNLLLHVAAESGLFVMGLYALLWARVLRRSWHASGMSGDGSAQFAVHAMLAAFFLRSLTDQFLSGLDTSFRMSCLVAFLFGLAEAAGFSERASGYRLRTTGPSRFPEGP